MSLPPPAPGPSLPQRLTLIVQALRAAIAAHAGRDRAAVAVVTRAWPYLHRLAVRFAALAARVRAGKVAAAVAPTIRLRAAPLAPRPRLAALPQGFGWLILLAPNTGALGGQVRHWMADPELAALLAAAPQAGRILRPLCRMLGIAAGPDFPPALFHSPAPSAPPPPAPSPALALAAPEPPATSSPAPQPQPPAPVRPPSRRLARRYWPVFRAEPA